MHLNTKILLISIVPIKFSGVFLYLFNSVACFEFYGGGLACLATNDFTKGPSIHVFLLFPYSQGWRFCLRLLNDTVETVILFLLETDVGAGSGEAARCGWEIPG